MNNAADKMTCMTLSNESRDHVMKNLEKKETWRANPNEFSNYNMMEPSLVNYLACISFTLAFMFGFETL